MMRAEVAFDGDAPDDERPTLPELIERPGFGMAQVRTSLIGGAVWFADGAELLLISTVTEAVSKEWDLGAFERGLVVSLVFVGVFFGNLIGGPLGDSCGRRFPIVISLVCIFMFSLLSAVSWNFWSLAFFRLIVGMSFGLGQPACQTLMTEMTPVNGRVIIATISNSLFSVGEMYSALLIMFDDPGMNHLHWRWLLLMGAIPAAFFATLAVLFLHNSPFYLSCCGRLDETRVVLESIRRDNRAQDVSIDFKPNRPVAGEPQKDDFGRQIFVIFGAELLSTTVILIFSCFVLNFTFYGSLYAFPQVMKEVEMGLSPGANLFIGAIWEIFGFSLGLGAAIFLARKPVIRLYLFLTNFSILAFCIGASYTGSNWIVHAFLYLGYYGIKLFNSTGFLIVYLYAAEVYPTVVRNTGSAVAFAGGRLAAMTSPLVFEFTQKATGRFDVFFYLIIALGVMNYFLTFWLPYETAGMMLRDRMPKGAGHYATC